MLKALLAALFLSACTASLVKTELDDSDIKTIGAWTIGSEDSGMFLSWFERGAERACSEQPYKLLERSYWPKTLQGYETAEDEYFWTVKCSPWEAQGAHATKKVNPKRRTE